MGILSGIKSLAPLSLYLFGGIAFIAGLAGRVQWTLLLVTLLIPLRNVIEKLQLFPGGNQYLDMLFFSMLVGWLISSSDKKPFMSRSSLNGPAIFIVIYMMISLLLGSIYLTGELSLDTG